MNPSIQLKSRADPDVELFGNPIVTERPLLSVPRYTGPFGLEYYFQLAEFSIDFHPSSVHSLPPELSPGVIASYED